MHKIAGFFKNIERHIIRFFKGTVIGLAMVVPGVSGGTMAIILGLYDKIIHSISSFFKDIKNNTVFLLVVGLGGITGLLAFSNIIEYGITHFKYPVIFLFLGIIIGGIPLLYKKAELNAVKPMDIIPFAAGLAIVIATSFGQNTIINLAAGEGALSILFMALAGFITAIALILPGISGSFFLLSIGLYDMTLSAINELKIAYLVPFAFGIAAGIILTTKILENLMQKRKRGTYLLILGFVIGSIFTLFKDNIPYGIYILYSLIALAAGFAITTLISKLSGKYNIE